MADSVLPWLTIALQAEPAVLALVQSIRNLTKKYPNLTPDQITALVQQAIVSGADPKFDEVLAKIAADKAAGPS